MNREILFRGKRVDNGEWVYGSPFIIGEENISFILNNCSTINFKDHDAEFSGFKVSRETIGQYTGLTDKHGNRIFEGDIMETTIMMTDKYYDDGDYIGPKILDVYFDVEFKFGEFVLTTEDNRVREWPIIAVLNDAENIESFKSQMFSNVDMFFYDFSEEDNETFESLVLDYGKPIDEILKQTVLVVTNNIHDYE